MALVNPGLKGRVLRQNKLNFRQIKQVQKIINSDKKLKVTYNTVGQSNISDAAPAFLELTTTSVGATDSTRSETEIHLLSYRLSFSIFREDTTTSTSPTYCRIMIVRGYQPLVAGDMPASMIATPNRDLMQVYYDKVLAFGPYDNDSSGLVSNIIYNMEIKKKFKTSKIPHLNVGYETTDTTANKNPIYFYVFNGVSGANNELQTRGFGVIKYYDKE